MTPPQPVNLLDQVRHTLRRKDYALRTEETYTRWIVRFIRFHHLRHPRHMDAPEIEAFLTHLAVDENVAASTQNQALAALLFLYREVLQQELSRPVDAVRAKKPPRLPTVLSQAEVRRLLARMSDPYLLMARLM